MEVGRYRLIHSFIHILIHNHSRLAVALFDLPRPQIAIYIYSTRQMDSITNIAQNQYTFSTLVNEYKYAKNSKFPSHTLH